MTTATILTEINQQIDRLTAARALLMHADEPLPMHAPASAHISITGGGMTSLHPISSPRSPTIHEVTHPKRKLSAAARQRISEAQQKRWRKYHREQKAAARKAVA